MIGNDLTDPLKPGAEQRAPLTELLARRAAEISFAQLPPDVVTRAKHSVLDWISVTLAGWSDPLVQKLVAYCDGEGGCPAATMLGERRKTSVSQAALINGSASHTLDFDDVHLPSRVHPSAPVLPAALAICERDGLSGEALITAFVAGVEVQSNIGAAMGDAHYRRGWHNTATLGAFGASAAAGRLVGLSSEEMQVGFGIAATQAAGLRAVFGSMCKPLQTGRASANGVMAASLAKAGFTSRTDVLECAEGFVKIAGAAPADGSAFAAAIEALSTGLFHTRSIIFKFHASCYGTHAPIESALQLRVLLDGQSPRSVQVIVEPQYLSVCNIQTPGDPLEAKFSLRHTVALALMGRDLSGGAAFSLETITDPDVIALRSRITVTSDGAMKRACARIVASAIDGSEYTIESDASQPEMDLSLQGRRIEDKFRALCAAHLSPSRREAVIDTCRNLEQLGRVQTLVDLVADRREA